jgi:hypothetical protein
MKPRASRLLDNFANAVSRRELSADVVKAEAGLRG